MIYPNKSKALKNESIAVAWGFQQVGKTSCWNEKVKPVVSPLIEQCEETKQGFPTVYPAPNAKHRK